MKKFLFFVLIVIFSFNLTAQTKEADKKAKELYTKFSKSIVVKEAVVYQNIAIFPVYNKTKKKIDTSKYISLDEGLKSKKIIITEKGSRLLTQEEEKELANLRKESASLVKKYGKYLRPKRRYYRNQMIQQQRYIPENEILNNPPNNIINNANNVNKKQKEIKLTEKEKKELPQIRKKYQEILKKIRQLTPSTGGSVNWLDIQNNSGKDLYIMAGEMVIGGKQDRITASDYVIPQGKHLPIKVFCVESGRWKYKTKQFQTMNVIAHGKLRYIAQKKKNQSEVWAEVSKTNESLKTQNDTSTYRKNYEDKKVLKHLEKYLAGLNLIKTEKEIKGIFVSINGKLIAADIFAYPSLFNKVKDKLVRSYSIEAILNLPKDKKEVKIPDKKEVMHFLEDLIKTNIDLEKKKAKYKKFSSKGKDFDSFGSVGENKEGELEILHLNTYRKK